jgi:hypothetical protein
MPWVDEFRSALWSQFGEAESQGLPDIKINSGELHKKVGGYPGPQARMPSCCQAMYHEQKAGDEVICRPPSGKGATLTIRYRLPRSEATISEAPRPEKPPAVVSAGISSVSHVVGRGDRRRNVADYDFELICEVKPHRDTDGNIRSFMPQDQYKNLGGLSLNKYGNGPFCKFKIPKNVTVCGVYIITIDDEVQYVGECDNLSSRYNAGYGNISPRNCFKKGQETNCRLNNLVHLRATKDETILLWFFRTTDYKKVERELRAILKPPWNRV